MNADILAIIEEMDDGVSPECSFYADKLRAALESEVQVCEGWWNPNVNRGIVHDHKPSQPMTMHLACEHVYTHRTVHLPAEVPKGTTT